MKKIGLLIFFLISNTCFSTPLPAKDIFQITVKSVDANTFLAVWKIKKGYFLYKDRIQFSPKADSNYRIGTLQFPDAFQKATPSGTEAIYRDQLFLSLPILGVEPGEGLLDVHYQGCSDDGFCYPPQVSTIKLAIDKNLALNHVNIEEASSFTTPEEEKDEDTFGQLFNHHHGPIILLIFFGFGLLLSFTPCILPMLPVLSGIIVGHGKNLSTRKGFLLSLTYVFSMSITYAIVGAMVALMGSNLQVIMQSPWAIGCFSLIFIALALSMFGIYDLRMPTAWQAKFANMTRLQKHGHYLSAAFMGCFSTLILSPCITPPLIGVLAYIAQKGNILLGSSALFCLSLGMGTPLILVGMSAGKWLPKAGIWMNTIKAIFGILLLGTAIYLLQRILSPLLIMWLWSLLCIFSSVYMGAFQKAQDRHQQFRQALGLILVSYGLLILIGISQGHTDPLQPLTSKKLDTKGNILTETTLEGVQETLQKIQDKPIILDFYADWCATCKHIEATTLQDPIVKTTLRDFIMIKIDLTKNNKSSKDLLHYFNVVAPPTFLFLNKNKDELPELRLIGNIKKEAILKNAAKMIN